MSKCEGCGGEDCPIWGCYDCCVKENPTCRRCDKPNEGYYGVNHERPVYCKACYDAEIEYYLNLDWN